MLEKDIQKNETDKGITNDRVWSYKRYTEVIDKYICVFGDTREINFQNDVIKPFLDEFYSGLDNNITIVNTSTQYRNRDSQIHDRSKYANKSTPDLLIARNWHYANKNHDNIEYLALVEIKSPKVNIDKYQMEDYLSIVPKVIYTNCYKWDFHKKIGKRIQTDSVNLIDGNNNWIKDQEGNFSSDKWEDLCKRLEEFIM